MYFSETGVVRKNSSICTGSKRRQEQVQTESTVRKTLDLSMQKVTKIYRQFIWTYNDFAIWNLHGLEGGGSRREKRAHIFPNITDIFYCDTHHNPPWCSPWTVHLLCLAPAWWDAVALPPPPPPPPPPPLPHHHHRYAPPADPRSSFYPPPPGPRTRPCRSSSALSPSRWTGPSFSASLCRWA